MTAQRFTAREAKLLAGLVVVIVTGLVSRMMRTGLPILDKYAGDALYAVMVYLIVTLSWKSATPRRRAVAVIMIMAGIETFQLTSIPIEMTRSANVLMSISGRLLGTTFSWLDLVAYCAGIVPAFVADQKACGERGRAIVFCLNPDEKLRR